MASFDVETFVKAQGQSATGALTSVGTAFGLPTCMLNLGANVLRLLPTSVLASMNLSAQLAKSRAQEIIAEIFKWLQLKTGIMEYIAEDGTIRFKLLESWMGLDAAGLQALADIGGILGALQAVQQFGSQLYANYELIKGEVEAITNCLNAFNTMKKFEKGVASAYTSPNRTNPNFEAQYQGQIAQLQYAQDFIAQCDTFINAVNQIIAERAADPTLEPQISDCKEFDQYLSGTTFCRVTPEDPGVLEEQDPIFRLTYGPPISVKGQYVLTVDGLYYDSRQGGIDTAIASISGMVPVGDAWKYDYDPNLGGKGVAVSLKTLDKFSDNLFDINIIDDSRGMQEYYDKDHFLAVIRQNRDKQVFDLSSDLQRFISNNEGAAVIANQRMLLLAEIENHNSKINRRKKQIEVAVKAPQIYGGKTSPIFKPGDVPINDFSYLADSNLFVDIEKQRSLTFKQGDVVGIILPLNPKFVRQSLKNDSTSVEHLRVANIGKGSIIYTPSSTNAGTVLSLTDQIVTEGLFGLYNFLETDVELPSSLEFNLTNCSTKNMYNNAQMVAPSRRSVYFSGMGIPYLEGIVKNKSTDPAGASGLGSFVRLPDTREFRDLTYSQEGFTIECWVHVPNITNGNIGWLSSTTSSLTKVLIGCENVGSISGYQPVDNTGALLDLDRLPNNKGDQLVRGMLCGFTRDRRITQENTGFSNLNSLNNPASSLSFFIAPTISRDSSSLSFINNDSCQNSTTFHKMKVDLSSTAFGNVSSQFVLIDITCDPQSNTIKMFADGNLIATSSISNVFGVFEKVPPGVPTFKKENSFEYSTSSVDGPSTLKQGPKLNRFYTPWIVGGGYTDGMYQYGNFMGGNRGGVVSGLRGHIGSLKFYSRPLDNSEVLTNYKAQQAFFKNIRT